jgi:hypothetical protein
MKMREGVLMFKLLLIAVAILAGAFLSARAEDQKTTNGLQQERPAEPTSTGLQQQSKKPTTTNLVGQVNAKPTTNNLQKPPIAAPSK